MPIKLKKVLANIFYVGTAIFFLLFALDAPQKSNVDFQSENNVATLTEFLTNTNYN